MKADFTETADLASRHPEKLKELQDLWWDEAEKYGALPQLEAITMRQRTYDQILTVPAALGGRRGTHALVRRLSSSSIAGLPALPLSVVSS